MKDIQFVYFDLDDTLLDHKKAQHHALEDVYTHFDQHFKGVALSDVQNTYSVHNSALWKQYAAGEIDRHFLQKQRFLRLIGDLGISTISHEEMGAFYLQHYAHYWDYCEGAYGTFMHIAEQFPVGILTNGFAEVQHAKLSKFHLLRDKLAATVISEEVGFMKPHPTLFKHASEVVNVPPEHILYIGDSFTSDIEGGRNAGWQVIWYAPHIKQAPQGIDHIRHLNELKEKVIA